MFQAFVVLFCLLFILTTSVGTFRAAVHHFSQAADVAGEASWEGCAAFYARFFVGVFCATVSGACLGWVLSVVSRVL